MTDFSMEDKRGDADRNGMKRMKRKEFQIDCFMIEFFDQEISPCTDEQPNRESRHTHYRRSYKRSTISNSVLEHNIVISRLLQQ